MADAIVHLINQERHADVQSTTTSSRYAFTLFPAAWLLDDNASFVVRLHPPAIGRMGLTDIDGKEFNLIPIAFFQFFQGPKLRPKRPSGKAAEHEHDRLETDPL